MKLTNSNLPHARKQLHQPSVRQRRRNDHRRRREIPHSQIDSTEQESRQREARQTQRSWVGEFVLGRLVETGLRGTAKGWQVHRVRRVDVCERVAAVAVVTVEGLLIVGILAVRVVGGTLDHGWKMVRLWTALVYG